jgi:hypothetical protein
MAEVDKMQQVYRNRYAFVIVMFGSACMFTQFWFHEMAVNYSKQLYSLFSETYPIEARAFLWAFESN